MTRRLKIVKLQNDGGGADGAEKWYNFRMADMLAFRFAEERDVPLVLAFIRELARYEKMEDLVVAQEDVLRDQLFAKRNAEVG